MNNRLKLPKNEHIPSVKERKITLRNRKKKNRKIYFILWFFLFLNHILQLFGISPYPLSQSLHFFSILYPTPTQKRIESHGVTKREFCLLDYNIIYDIFCNFFTFHKSSILYYFNLSQILINIKSHKAKRLKIKETFLNFKYLLYFILNTIHLKQKYTC